MSRATPAEALAVLRTAADDGRLDALCHRAGVGLLVAFGSAAREEPDPSDLDLAYTAEADRPVDVLAFLAELVGFLGTDAR